MSSNTSEPATPAGRRPGAIRATGAVVRCDNCGVPDAATTAQTLIRIVVSDVGLPRRVRRQAGELTEVAAFNPVLAVTRLKSLCETVGPELPVQQATVDYARCVSIDAFWRHNLVTSRKRLFRGPEEYRSFVEAQPDRSRILSADLAPGRVFPARNSWLVPFDDLRGLTGVRVRTRLQMRQDPPYAVFVLPVTMMRQAGVVVREPRGTDAVLGEHSQWHPRGVPNERIDRDVDASAVARVE